MPVFVTAETGGLTETEAKERARIAQAANDSLLVSKTPTSASFSVVDPDAGRVLEALRPGRAVRVVLDGSASQCSVRQGSASVQFEVRRLAVKEGRKTISDLITGKQKGL